MKTKLVNNILSVEINKQIINDLVNHHWYIAWDNDMNRVEKIFSNKNNGFSIITYDYGKPIGNSPLNKYGKMVFDIVIKKTKLKAELERIFWNMYFKNSESELHKDRPKENFISVVYNLHTTDGGTEIDDKFYKDMEGQAKIFNSNILHKGVGAKNSNVRFNLNLILKI